MVSATDPYGRALDFLDQSRYFFFQVAPRLYWRGWMDSVPDPLLLRKSGSIGNWTQASGTGFKMKHSNRQKKAKFSLWLIINYALCYEDINGSGDLALPFLIFCTRWRWVVSFMSSCFNPGEISPLYQLDRKLGGPQRSSRCYREERNLIPDRNWTPTMQPIAHWYYLHICMVTEPWKICNFNSGLFSLRMQRNNMATIWNFHLAFNLTAVTMLH
jgi:hypothetical protein